MYAVQSALHSLQHTLKQKIAEILVIIQNFETPLVGAPIQNFEILFWDQANSMALLI